MHDAPLPGPNCPPGRRIDPERAGKMAAGPFTAAQMRPIRPGMTVSRPAGLGGGGVSVTWFSLGAGTSITPERYDCPCLYLPETGGGSVLLEGQTVPLCPGEILAVPAGALCGPRSDRGMVYTEILIEKGEERILNDCLKAGRPTALQDLIGYETGSIASLDLVRTDGMKFVLMAFDAGTGLTPHRAPGNAILTALEGEAVIGYEGRDYPLRAGESFRFDKEGLHSVTPQGRFKMSLLLVMG